MTSARLSDNDLRRKMEEFVKKADELINEGKQIKSELKSRGQNIQKLENTISRGDESLDKIRWSTKWAIAGGVAGAGSGALIGCGVGGPLGALIGTIAGAIAGGLIGGLFAEEFPNVVKCLSDLVVLLKNIKVN